MKSLLLALTAALVAFTAQNVSADVPRPRTREAVTVARIVNDLNYDKRQSEREAVLSASVLQDSRIIVRTSKRLFFDFLSMSDLVRVMKAVKSLEGAALTEHVQNAVCEIVTPEFRTSLLVKNRVVLNKRGCVYTHTILPADDSLAKTADETLELISNLAEEALSNQKPLK